MSHQEKELTVLLSKRRRWLSLIVLSASLFVLSIDMTILNVALPDLSLDLGATAEEQLWMIDIFSLILAGLLIPMSVLADRWGRKRMLLIGFGIFGGASFFVLFATNSLFVIGLRAVLGIGGAMIMPTTLSLIRSIFIDPKERAQALGVWAGVAGVGIALGPIIGGLLLEYFSWHAAFLVNVPLMIVATIAGWILLPEVRLPNPPRWDMLASLLSITGMVLLIWGVKSFAKEGISNPFIWMAMIVAVFLLSWFVLRCLRSPEPFLDVRLFKRKPFTAGVIAALLTMFAMAAVLYLVAQWLQLVKGLSPLESGIRLLPLALGAIIATTIAPPLASRIGARIVLSGGLFIAGVGFSVLYISPELNYTAVMVTLILLGAGTGSLAIATTTIMASTPVEKAGNASAIEESAYDFGNVLGIAVLGSLATNIYRKELNVAELIYQGLPRSVADSVEESLASSLTVAIEIGSSELVALSLDAFTTSLIRTGLAGSVVMIAAAVLVFFLIPNDFDITTES